MTQKAALPFLAAIAFSAHGATPLDSSTPNQANPSLPTDEVIGIPVDAYGAAPTKDIPYRNLFRNTGVTRGLTTSDPRLTPTIRPADNFRVKGNLDLPDLRGRFPLLQRGFAPEDADLKIGPLYFNLRQFSVGVQWTDNARRDGQNRESETRGFASIGAQVIWQISEASRLSASGNFVWFPFEGQGGVSGFALRSPVSFGLASAPDAQVQASWEPTILGVPWVIADELHTAVGRYTNGVRDDTEIFEGFSIDNSDGQSGGNYSFRSPKERKSRGFRQQTNNSNNEVLLFSNIVSATTTAKVPGDFNLHFRAAHENIWYIDNNDRNLPPERNTVFSELESYRESFRFKPYLRYNLSQHPDPERLYQAVRVGARGPVTDLINFDGNVGHFWEEQSGRESFLWRAHFDHIINPLTRHMIEWSRDLEDLSDQLVQHVRYQFHHVLGPGLSGDVYGGYNWVEDLDGVFADREELNSGLRLSWRVSPKTTVRFLGQYADTVFSSGSFDTQVWRGRLELSHRFGDRINTRIIYQHTKQESGNGAAEYDENLLYFSMSYIFE